MNNGGGAVAFSPAFAFRHLCHYSVLNCRGSRMQHYDLHYTTHFLSVNPCGGPNSELFSLQSPRIWLSKSNNLLCTWRQRSKSKARERGSRQHLLRMAETADDSAMIISASLPVREEAEAEASLFQCEWSLRRKRRALAYPLLSLSQRKLPTEWTEILWPLTCTFSEAWY